MATNITSTTPPSTTSPDNEAVMALKHILQDVLGYEPNSYTEQAFSYFGIQDVDEFLLARPQDDIKGAAFNYIDPTDPSNKIRGILSVIQVRKLELLQQWYYEQDEPTTSVWFSLTASSFKRWTNQSLAQRHTPTKVASTPFQPMTPSTPTNNVQNSSTPVVDSEAVLFRKGIKRSVTDYNKFKDDSKWKQWNRHLKAMANSHSTSNVLDP